MLNSISGHEYIKASERGDLDVIKQYLHSGGDLYYREDAQDKGPFGSFTIGNATALHQAAAFNQAEVVAFLLDKGMSTELKTDEKWVPLHAATFKGHREAAKVLIYAGANLYTEDKNGYTPIDGARNTHRYGILEDIKNYQNANKDTHSPSILNAYSLISTHNSVTTNSLPMSEECDSTDCTSSVKSRITL
jgi:ankyrin repeat protein